jgi:hypothetical protein
MEMQVRFGRKQGQLNLHLIMLLWRAAFFAMIYARRRRRDTLASCQNP